MNKFGLDPVEPKPEQAEVAMSARLAAFPLAAPRQKLDISLLDAAGTGCFSFAGPGNDVSMFFPAGAAAPHGFISREAKAAETVPASRRRRIGAPEPTRHLAVRLTMAQYDRFVAYADKHRVTYQDALDKLLSESGF